MCADALAADVVGDRITYAKALTRLESTRGLRLAPAASGAGHSELALRIGRLLGRCVSRTSRTRSTVGVAIVLLVGCAYPAVHHSTKAKLATTQPIAGADKPSPQPAPQPVQESAEAYAIAPGDLVRFAIMDLQAQNSEWSKTIRIEENGIVTLPYINTIKIGGLSVAQAEAAIAKEYKDHQLLAAAVVSVTVQEARGRSYEILGAVAQPGQYAMPDSNVRLFDALAMAHGLANVWNGRFQVRIIRNQQSSDIDGHLVFTADPRANVIIKPHDTIAVISAAPATQPAAEQPADSLELAGERSAISEIAREYAQAQIETLDATQKYGPNAAAVISLQAREESLKKLYDAHLAAGRRARASSPSEPTTVPGG